MTPTQIRFVAFLILLVTVIFVTVLYATGFLRFPASGPFTFVIYVLSGLLSAALTFGVLKSSGKVKGHSHGFDISIAGPIVALVFVAGGGMAYEKWLRTPDHFDMRLVFEDSMGTSIAISGLMQILYGSERRTERINNASNVLIQGIAIDQFGNEFRVELSESAYVADTDVTTGNMLGEGPIVLTVRKNPNAQSFGGSLLPRTVDEQIRIARQRDIEIMFAMAQYIDLKTDQIKKVVVVNY